MSSLVGTTPSEQTLDQSSNLGLDFPLRCRDVVQRPIPRQVRRLPESAPGCTEKVARRYQRRKLDQSFSENHDHGGGAFRSLGRASASVVGVRAGAVLVLVSGGGALRSVVLSVERAQG